MDKKKSLRILVVEDDKHNLVATKGTFECKGHRVIPFRFARQAIRSIPNIDYDVAVIDYSLDAQVDVCDTTGGIDVAEVSKQYYPKIPVVILSGYSDLGNLPCVDKIINKGSFSIDLEDVVYRLATRNV